MKRARVSAEEKRVRTIDFFHEQKTLFSLKELESKLPKEKGIIQQAVKDLIEEIVADNIVEKDKIGSGNYFWSFPSKALSVRQNKLNAIQEQIDELEKKKTELQAVKRKLEESREVTEERLDLLKELDQEINLSEKYDLEISQNSANDPDKVKKVADYAVLAKNSANRWTDNIHEVMRFYKNRSNGFDAVQFMKHFE